MKKTILFFIISIYSVNLYAFKIKLINNYINNSKIDKSLGEVSSKLCDSDTLISMSELGEGSIPARCVNIINGKEKKIILLIPVKIIIYNNENKNGIVLFKKNTSEFNYFSLRSCRNFVKYGCVDLFEESVSIKDNESIKEINAELEMEFSIDKFKSISLNEENYELIIETILEN